MNKKVLNLLLLVLVTSGLILAIILSVKSPSSNKFINICKVELPNTKNITPINSNGDYISYQAWGEDITTSLDSIRNIYHKASTLTLPFDTVSVQVYSKESERILCGSFISVDTLYNTEWSSISTYDEFIEKANILFK